MRQLSTPATQDAAAVVVAVVETAGVVVEDAGVVVEDAGVVVEAAEVLAAVVLLLEAPLLVVFSGSSQNNGAVVVTDWESSMQRYPPNASGR